MERIVVNDIPFNMDIFLIINELYATQSGRRGIIQY